MKWISVKEKLPLETGDYLVFVAIDKKVKFFWWESTSWIDYENASGCCQGPEYHHAEYVTHWMPLPEPPKE